MVLSGRFFIRRSFGSVVSGIGFRPVSVPKSRTGHRPAGCGFQLFGRFFDFSGLSRSRRPLPSGTAGFRVTRRPFRSAVRISVRETGFRIAGMPSGSSWRFFSVFGSRSGLFRDRSGLPGRRSGLFGASGLFPGRCGCGRLPKIPDLPVCKKAAGHVRRPFYEPNPRFELGTPSLRVKCSTAELIRPAGNFLPVWDCKYLKKILFPQKF